MYQYELFAHERPIAIQTALHANLNRDSKKRKKPYTPEDYYLYQPRDEQSLPAGRAAAAAIELIRLKQFPSWALFCYKELALAAADREPPALLAFTSDNAILLAPSKTTGGYNGMLIATEKAGDQWIVFDTPDGTTRELYVPEVPTKFVAQDNVMLRSR